MQWTQSICICQLVPSIDLNPLTVIIIDNDDGGDDDGGGGGGDANIHFKVQLCSLDGFESKNRINIGQQVKLFMTMFDNNCRIIWPFGSFKRIIGPVCNSYLDVFDAFRLALSFSSFFRQKN